MDRRVLSHLEGKAMNASCVGLKYMSKCCIGLSAVRKWQNDIEQNKVYSTPFLDCVKGEDMDMKTSLVAMNRSISTAYSVFKETSKRVTQNRNKTAM